MKLVKPEPKCLIEKIAKEVQMGFQYDNIE